MAETQPRQREEHASGRTKGHSKLLDGNSPSWLAGGSVLPLRLGDLLDCLPVRGRSSSPPSSSVSTTRSPLTTCAPTSSSPSISCALPPTTLPSAPNPPDSTSTDKRGLRGASFCRAPANGSQADQLEPSLPPVSRRGQRSYLGACREGVARIAGYRLPGAPQRDVRGGMAQHRTSLRSNTTGAAAVRPDQQSMRR